MPKPCKAAKTAGRLFGLAFALIVTPSIAQESAPSVSPAWFEGLTSGSCVKLEPNSEFVQKHLIQDEKVEVRTAFVIGNADYAVSQWKLDNPTNDAAGIARMLQSVGFTVFVALNGTGQTIEDCAAQVASAKSDLSLLYYSGHGIQREYNNYIVATDLEDIETSQSSLVSLDNLILEMSSKSQSLLVFLDACRDNPLAATQQAGLAPEQVAPRSINLGDGSTARSASGNADPASDAALKTAELFVAFSTSPNSVASDGTGDLSRFTAGVLKHATSPGWSVQRAIAQVTKEVGEASDWSQTPWSRSSLTTEVFLNGGVDPDNALRASNLKAQKALELLSKGERKTAIATALQGLPENFTAEDIEKYSDAYSALFKAVRSRNRKLPLVGSLHVTWSNDGTRLVTVPAEVGSSGRKSGVNLWDATNGKLIQELLPVERAGTVGSTLGSASFSADGSLVAHIDPKKERPIVWDARTGQLIRELAVLQGASGMMTTVPVHGLSALGNYFLAHSASYGLRVYDVSTGKPLWTKKLAGIGSATSFTPDEASIVTASVSGGEGGGEYQSISIQALDTRTGKAIWTKEVDETTWGAHVLVLSDDGSLVGVATSSDAAILYNRSTDQVHRIKIPRAGMAGFSISPDNKYLAVMSDNWDSVEPIFYSVETGEKIDLPKEDSALLDTVHDDAGSAVGIPYFPSAGKLWRAGVSGPELHDVGRRLLTQDQLSNVSKDRVSFR